MTAFKANEVVAIYKDGNAVSRLDIDGTQWWPQTGLFSPDQIKLVPDPDVWGFNYRHIVFDDVNDPRSVTIVPTTLTTALMGLSPISSGKASFEVVVNSNPSPTFIDIGLVDADLQSSPVDHSRRNAIQYANFGTVRNKNVLDSTRHIRFSGIAELGVEVDADAKTVVFINGGVRSKTYTFNATSVVPLFIVSGLRSVAQYHFVNFGQEKPRNSYSHDTFGWPKAAGSVFNPNLFLVGNGWYWENERYYSTTDSQSTLLWAIANINEAINFTVEAGRYEHLTISRPFQGTVETSGLFIAFLGVSTVDMGLHQLRYYSDGVVYEYSEDKGHTLATPDTVLFGTIGPWEAWGIGDTITIAVTTNYPFNIRILKNDVLQGEFTFSNRNILFNSEIDGGGHILHAVSSAYPGNEVLVSYPPPPPDITWPGYDIDYTEEGYDAY